VAQVEMGTAAVAVGTAAVGAAADAEAETLARARAVGVRPRGPWLLRRRVPRGVAPEAPMRVGRYGVFLRARGGVGGFGDTTMIARQPPSHHQGKP
jgi:hypothetical protein